MQSQRKTHVKMTQCFLVRRVYFVIMCRLMLASGCTLEYSGFHLSVVLITMSIMSGSITLT